MVYSIPLHAPSKEIIMNYNVTVLTLAVVALSVAAIFVPEQGTPSKKGTCLTVVLACIVLLAFGWCYDAGVYTGSAPIKGLVEKHQEELEVNRIRFTERLAVELPPADQNVVYTIIGKGDPTSAIADLIMVQKSFILAPERNESLESPVMYRTPRDLKVAGGLGVGDRLRMDPYSHTWQVTKKSISTVSK
jgi:hypothetical protein